MNSDKKRLKECKMTEESLKSSLKSVGKMYFLVKKLALMCGILLSMVSLGLTELTKELKELDELVKRAERLAADLYVPCVEKGDKSVCEKTINSGYLSLDKCGDARFPYFFCSEAAEVYLAAGRYEEAIPYLEKVIVYGGYKYAPIVGIVGCYKGNGDLFQAISCFKLAEVIYKEDIHHYHYKIFGLFKYETFELFKKACDLKYGVSCAILGGLYYEGQGVRQDKSIAKEYYGKACDLGNQVGCDYHKELHEKGIIKGFIRFISAPLTQKLSPSQK